MATEATAVTTVVETEVETDEYMGVVEVEEKKKIVTPKSPKIKADY